MLQDICTVLTVIHSKVPRLQVRFAARQSTNMDLSHALYAVSASMGSVGLMFVSRWLSYYDKARAGCIVDQSCGLWCHAFSCKCSVTALQRTEMVQVVGASGI